MTADAAQAAARLAATLRTLRTAAQGTRHAATIAADTLARIRALTGNQPGLEAIILGYVERQLGQRRRSLMQQARRNSLHGA